MHSNVHESDELLTRYSEDGKRKVVIRKDVRVAIKSAASIAGKSLGGSPAMLAADSLRLTTFRLPSALYLVSSSYDSCTLECTAPPVRLFRWG